MIFNKFSKLIKHFLTNNRASSLIQLSLSTAVITSVTGVGISTYNQTFDNAKENLDKITVKQISTYLNISSKCDYLLLKYHKNPINKADKKLLKNEISQYFNGKIPKPQQTEFSFWLIIDKKAGFIVTLKKSATSNSKNSELLNLYNSSDIYEININEIDE